jgi:hypothetical protein
MTHRAPPRFSTLAARCVVALAIVSGFPVPAAAQTQEERERFYEGTEVLRRIFFDRDCTPIESFRDVLERENPKDVILFFLGSGGIERIDGLVDFVRSGGAVMIATSNPVRSRDAETAIAELTGLEIVGRRLVYPRDTSDPDRVCYEGKPHCPILLAGDPVSARFDRLFRAPGTGEPLRVVANEPTYFSTVDRRRLPGNVLAYLPPGAVFEDTRAPIGSGDGEIAVAVGGELGEGRFIVVANHRLFLNRMMLPQDTKNVEFARNCLSVLEARRDGGTRKKVLFVQYGHVNPNFNVPLKDLDIPIPDNLPEILAGGIVQLGKWLPQLQTNLAESQRRDEFRSGLWRVLKYHNITGADLMHWVVLVVSALFAVYGLVRIVGPGRYRLDPATPLLPSVVARHRPKTSLFERRRKEMLDNNNLWEAARDRARMVLLAAGVSEPGPGGREPKVEVRGGWWHRLRTRRRVLRLWRLAFDPTPQLVPRSAWELINRELDGLKAALASGAVRLV